MSIPQINKEQIQTLMGMVGPIDAFSQVVPSKDADGDSYEGIMESVRDTEQLVILGLIKEITDDCGDKLANIYAMTNRMFRVFQITDIGRAMFSVERTTVN
jgi:hypothetical protein